MWKILVMACEKYWNDMWKILVMACEKYWNGFLKQIILITKNEIIAWFHTFIIWYCIKVKSNSIT